MITSSPKKTPPRLYKNTRIKQKMCPNFKVDVVIAWVDGSDEKHFRKRKKHQDSSTFNPETRFSDRGEIYYCIASILKYAGFINRVFIITDDQIPEFINEFHLKNLCDKNFITIVDHTELFTDFQEFLPTFNCRSIEAVFWRIKDLSEHYIYLNDDFFINQEVGSDQFFMDSKPVLRGLYKSMLDFNLKKLLFPLHRNSSKNPGFAYAQMEGAAKANSWLRYYKLDHHPHPLRKSTQEKFYTEKNDILREQIQYKFRSLKQYNPISLANHLEIMQGNAILEAPANIIYIHPDMNDDFNDELLKIKRGDSMFGCMQSLDLFSPGNLKTVRQVMAEKLGDFLPEKMRL